MVMIKEAEAELNTIIAKRRVVAALKRDIAPAAYRVYYICEELILYYEKIKDGLVHTLLNTARAEK